VLRVVFHVLMNFLWAVVVSQCYLDCVSLIKVTSGFLLSLSIIVHRLGLWSWCCYYYWLTHAWPEERKNACAHPYWKGYILSILVESKSLFECNCYVERHFGKFYLPSIHSLSWLPTLIKHPPPPTSISSSATYTPSSTHHFPCFAVPWYLLLPAAFSRVHTYIHTETHIERRIYT